jgi:hypothetical protein
MSYNKTRNEALNEVQSYVNEAEQNVIEDITNFDGTEEAEIELYGNIQFYIKMNQSLLPDLKKFLMNKSDLYIMNGMHAEINYDVVVIPNPLHFFRIIAVPFGVCNISTEALDKEIFNDLKQNIKNAYTNKKLARQPVHKITHVLKSVQKKLFDINNREINSKNKTSYNEEFKKYAHIPPKISDFRVGDKMINKDFSTKLIIVNGKLLYEEHIYIAFINEKRVEENLSITETHFEDRLNLLDYLIPKNIEYTYETNEWRVTYSMQDVINLLHSTNIKRVVYIDLSCSNNASNNTQTIMNKTNSIEGQPYVSVGKNRRIRNKNTQYLPKRINKNVMFSNQYTHKRKSRRYTKSKTKTKTKSPLF